MPLLTIGSNMEQKEGITLDKNFRQKSGQKIQHSNDRKHGAPCLDFINIIKGENPANERAAVQVQVIAHTLQFCFIRARQRKISPRKIRFS